MKTKPYDYQAETADDIFSRISENEIRGAYLGFDTGTGKTVTSLYVAEQLYKNHMIKGLVVICPVSKVDDWNKDIKEEVPDIEMTFVSSFQSAWREKNKAKIELICKMTDTLIIVDEGHKMKTYDSKQSKFIQELSSKYTPYMLILSATSQNKKYIDLYPQYKALGSKVFDIKAKDFKRDYCIEAANYNLVYAGKSRFPFNEIVGYRQTDVMDKEVLNYTYYKKYESKYDKPIEIRQTFKMTPEMKYFKEKKVWPKMDEKALEAALMSGDIEDIDTDFIIANRPALHHIYMRESCSGFIKDYYLKDNPKLQWLKDFLEGNEGRIVVFTNFVAETVLINRLCLEMKRHCCIYDGANKDLTNWHEHDDCVVIVNIQAGSAGLNDFIKTNIAIWFSYPENYIDFIQSKGRLDRIGQTKQPVFYFLEIANSVEQAIYRTLLSGESFDLRLFEKWLEEGGK
jgi:SNF2 family DNA or RNA helicase